MSDTTAVAENRQQYIPGAPPPSPEKKKSRRKKKKIAKRIVAFLVVVAIVGGISYSLYSLFNVQEAELYPWTSFVSRGSITSQVNGTGVTRAKDSASVVLPAAGMVSEVFVSEGDWVKKGDPLYIVDSESARKDVDDAQKRVDDIQSQIDDIYESYKDLVITAPFSGTLTECLKLKEGDSVMPGTKIASIYDDSIMLMTLYFSYAYEHDIAVGQPISVSVPSMMSTVSGTVTEINYIRKITPEGSPLFQVIAEVPNPGTLTEGMTASASFVTADGETAYPYEAAQFEYNQVADITAKAAGDAMDYKLRDYMIVTEGETLLKLSETTSAEQVKTLQTQLEAAYATLEKAQDFLAQFEPVAPMDGQVITCSLTVGKEAEAGRTAISISDTSIMIIDAQIDEMNISYVKPGMSCTITQWGRNGQETFFGTIDTVSFEAKYENGISRFPATIRVENDDGRLMTGMYVDYSLTAAQSEDCLTVPLGAVQYTVAGTCLFVKSDTPPENALDAEALGIVIPDGFYAVPVVIGLSDNQMAEVSDGVEEMAEIFTQYQSEPMDGGASYGGMSSGPRRASTGSTVIRVG